MDFKLWLLEFEGKDIKYYQNILLSKLDLDKDKGLSQSLNVWESDKLLSKIQDIGEFKNLSSDLQKEIIDQINSKTGTLNDLAVMMSSAE